MIEIGQYKLVDNIFSVNRLMSVNASLKSDNSILTYCLIGGLIFGVILLYGYLVSQEELKKMKVPQLLKNQRNPI